MEENWYKIRQNLSEFIKGKTELINIYTSNVIISQNMLPQYLNDHLELKKSYYTQTNSQIKFFLRNQKSPDCGRVNHFYTSHRLESLLHHFV